VVLIEALFRVPRGHRLRRSLPRLTEAHPQAWQAPRRARGLVTVEVSAVVGTASALPGTRRTDFRPSEGHVPAGWQLRWSRLAEAARNLTPLPPIEVLKAGDGYWVLDGHNRVALAKSTGQEWIDAQVTELVVPAVRASTTSAQPSFT